MWEWPDVFLRLSPWVFLSDVLKWCQCVSIVLLGSNFYSQVNIWLMLEWIHVDLPFLLFPSPKLTELQSNYHTLWRFICVSLLCVVPPKCTSLTDFFAKEPEKMKLGFVWVQWAWGRGLDLILPESGCRFKTLLLHFLQSKNITEYSGWDLIACLRSALTFHTLLPFYRAESSGCLQNAIV